MSAKERKLKLFREAFRCLSNLFSVEFFRGQKNQLGYRRLARLWIVIFALSLYKLIGDLVLCLIVPDYPFEDETWDKSTSTLADGTVQVYQDGKWV